MNSVCNKSCILLVEKERNSVPRNKTPWLGNARVMTDAIGEHRISLGARGEMQSTHMHTRHFCLSQFRKSYAESKQLFSARFIGVCLEVRKLHTKTDTTSTWIPSPRALDSEVYCPVRKSRCGNFWEFLDIYYYGYSHRMDIFSFCATKTNQNKSTNRISAP